jgi:gamma-glutamyltranspeptidase/glutathione hydrolase
MSHPYGKIARSRDGMVVAAHPMAAEAGVEILRRGGNAVEAAVATSLTLGVVEPFASGLGGGGYFMICPKGDPARTEILDGRGTTSTLLGGQRTYPFGVSLPWMPRMGVLSAAIPGLGRTLALALRKHGGRIPFRDLFAPAIRAAGKGFSVSKTYVRCQNSFEGTIRVSDGCARTFLRKGRLLNVGDRLRQPDLARTLKSVARQGLEILYRGSIGREMLREVNRTGPVWARSDLTGYIPKTRSPLRSRVGGCDVATMPPPSRGGVGILHALLQLERQGAARLGVNSGEWMVRLAELIRNTFQKLEPAVSDPDHADVPLSELIPSASTTHFTIADREGTIVTASQTIGHFFGAGLVVRGVVLNDDLSDCDRSPGRPNSIQPGRRTVSNMAPTLVFRDGRPWLALGTPGSLRIFPAMTQVLANAILFGMNLEQAVAAGRIHWEEGTVYLEGHISGADRLKARTLIAGRVVDRGPMDLFFGGVHAVEVLPDGTVVGVADPRRDGVAIGL